METAELRAELNCTICLEIYTDPVTLPCGHNYCLACIDTTWEKQKEMEEDPSCPVCRESYGKRPRLIRNETLRIIAEMFLPSHSQDNRDLHTFTSCLSDPPTLQDSTDVALATNMASSPADCPPTEGPLCSHLPYSPASADRETGCHPGTDQCFGAEGSACGNIKEGEVETGTSATLCGFMPPYKTADKLCQDTECGASHAEIAGASETSQGPDQDITKPAGGYGQWATSMFLDIDTAANYVFVSADRKMASSAQTDQGRPHIPERLNSFQVFSTRSFSSGKHYWDVEVLNTGTVLSLGVAYQSVNRQSDTIGCNEKSWCLGIHGAYSVHHNDDFFSLSSVPSCNRIRVSLDWDVGRLSFYELRVPIKHLYTFTATFSEPLHAAFSVGESGLIRIIS
ncbi:hypothetical protein XELAEV_18032565mg [Xenopus laevis]|uniref:Uncharacterized protein n=1 Tax=Xenopus laevis TaxID=8355 RepID=A0A974CPV2_XENLA|nr:hypothetical protein XELAEV_18032565mg [Xenopus laevis]